jgi:hypothetical protein
MQTRRAVVAALALCVMAAACGRDSGGGGNPIVGRPEVCTDAAKDELTTFGQSLASAFEGATFDLVTCGETSYGWTVTVTFEPPAEIESVRSFIASAGFDEAPDRNFERILGDQLLLVMVHDRDGTVFRVSGQELLADTFE